MKQDNETAQSGHAARAEYLGEMRDNLRKLDANLQRLQQRSRTIAHDAEAYARYQQQFELIQQRRSAITERLERAEGAAGDAAAWAELKTEIDLAWRELLTANDAAGNGPDEDPQSSS
ncbi:MAG: hypothetical protein WD928_02450 [Gammaproteobacteria bacterium]